MSEDVHYKGKIKATGKTLEEYSGKKFDDDDRWDYIYNNNICILDNWVYEIVVTDDDPYQDIYNMRQGVVQGEYEFEVKFYNGGCSLLEALETAYKGMAHEAQ